MARLMPWASGLTTIMWAESTWRSGSAARSALTNWYMGVTVSNVSDELQSYGIPAGASIQLVNEDSPAEKAGLKEKDIITEANGERVKSSQDLVDVVDHCGEGDTIELTVYRYSYDLDGNLSGNGYEVLHLTLQLEIID